MKVGDYVVCCVDFKDNMFLPIKPHSPRKGDIDRIREKRDNGIRLEKFHHTEENCWFVSEGYWKVIPEPEKININIKLPKT